MVSNCLYLDTTIYNRIANLISHYLYSGNHYNVADNATEARKSNLYMLGAYHYYLIMIINK